MNGIKISELDELYEANDEDLLVIVDSATDTTKKIKGKNAGFGGGGAYIGEEPPVKESYNLWINPEEPLNNVGTEVVDSLSGNETDKAPSVRAVNEVNKYSTEETFTGKYWIDGKPIYRKVIEFGALPNATNKAVSSGLANVNIISIGGKAKRSSDGLTITLPYAVTDFLVGLMYVSNSNEIRVVAESDMSAYDDVHITLEYTKTTD